MVSANPFRSAKSLRFAIPFRLGISLATLATAAASLPGRLDDRPFIGLDSPSVVEGDAGTTTLTFTARLTDANGRTKASKDTINASYQVSSEDGNTATAGNDYVETSGTLTFAPGETSKTVDVAVIGDTEDEDDETLTMRWTTWDGDKVLLASYTATGTIVDDDAAPPAEVTIADASAEEGDAITFTVTLDAEVPGGLTVTPRYRDETATSGTDYARNTESISFVGTAGETHSFSVATSEDEDIEGDETFAVGLVVWGTSSSVTAPSIATGTITDDDFAPPAEVTIADASASEGDAITFTVTLDRAVAGGLTVTPSFTDGTATQGTDYTENTTGLAFAGTAGETQTFTVSTTEDTDIEGDETFTVDLTVSGTSDDVTATSTATGTITDDDFAPPAEVTIADASASEGDAITFTVTLDRAVAGGLTVTPSFTDGTATKGTDYTENTTALAFAGTAGETQTFTVSTTEDTDVEGDETFTVALSVSGTSDDVTATSTATGTITDDDFAPPAEVTIADASASEGDAITFTVTLDSAVSGGLTVTPSFTDGTATKGTDYTENTTALTFAGTAGETQTFTVSTTEDTDVEGDETFTVDLSVSGTSDDVTATSTATGTITDDDFAPPAEVTIADASASEGDAITFTVTLDKAVAGGLTVTPSFTDGTATKGTDYTENTTGLAFAGTAGETQTFTVSTTEDTDVEGDETFTVSLTVSGTSDDVTATSTATGTITDDDFAPPAEVTIADASASEGDAITFTVTLDSAVSGGLTVTPSFTDGTATKGTDYTENTTALTFAGTAGETQTFTVSTTEDTDIEGDETFTVGLAVSGTSDDVTATSTATGTITDDDTAPAAEVTIADARASEGDTITFTVTLDSAVAGGLTVTPSFTDGTATKGTDYTENTAALAFTGTAGETQTFTVSTTEDTDVEGDETFTVALSVSGTSEDLTATSTATGTITDDDTAPAAAVTIADASASEGDAITFTVTLDSAVAGGLTVTPSFTDGTATKGTDYTENTTGLAFAGTAGETQTFTVSTTEDTDVEGDETFTVDLTVSGTSDDVTATSTATGTITDDDFAPPAEVTIADASASEGDAITFTVTLDSAVAGGLTVTPSFTDGTATKGTDYTENTTALAFAGTAGETQTFTVSTTEDTDIEGDETFTVALSVSGTSDDVTATSTATGTITDDDTAPAAAVTIADASASEGDAITFTVTLDRAVTGGLTVTPSFTDGTATKGTDYTENTTALAFAGTAGETQTFTVSTTEDTDVEGDETFTVGLTVSGTSDDVTATSTATGTITDDDTAPAAAVTIADASASEGDAITFTVTLDSAVAGGLTVTPSFTDGTATKGTDYTENTTGLAFAGTAGETQTFTVSTTEDTDVEGDETFTVGLTVSGTSDDVTATSTATGTITDDDTAPAAAVTIADASASEGDAITFTVTLDRAVSGGLTVTPPFTDVTATKGTDYTENTTALAFAGKAGETQTFTVSTTEDTDVEGDETFTVGLTVSGTTESVTATSTATGTITDDDTAAAAALSIADAKAVEGKSIAFTVTLDKAVRGGFKVTPTYTDVTATKGTDYTASTTALEFQGTANESVSFTVPTTDDGDSEANETFTVGLSVSGTSHSVTATATATGTITDNDGATGEWHYGAKLSAAPDSVSEDGGKQKVTVTADVSEWGVSSSDISYEVTVGKGGDAAVSGTDYKAVSKFKVVIPGGRRSGSNSFNLEPIANSDYEGDETITIHGTGPGGTQSTTLTLTDEGDRPYSGPQVTLSANPSKVSEADGATTVTVTAASASHSASRKVTVTVGGSGTATSGTDYAAVSNFDITIAANAKSATGTFTLTPTQDKLVEGDETIALAGNVEGVSGKLTGTTLTLTDDEPVPNVSLSVSPSSVTENGGAKTVTVTATSSAAAANARTLLVAVGNRQDTATPGTDYATVPAFNITIAANATTATGTFTLTPTNDTSVEDAESISIEGSPESAGAVFTVGGTAMTLTDDDALPGVTLSAAPSSVAEGALATSVTVTATAASAVAWARTVTVSVGASGTAASGTDYAAVSNFDITIPASRTTGKGTFTLTPTQDITNEGNETIGVSGTSPRTTVTGTTVTLADDDINPAVTLSVNPSTVSEGASATTVTVTATAASAMSAARTVTVSVGASGTATSGTDYAAVSNFTITIAANATSGTGTFTLTPTQNTVVEGAKTIGVAGTSPGTTVTGTTVALTDDDTHPAVTLSVSPSSVGEGASATSVTVTATAASSISSTRTVTVSVGQTGTAASGTDYAAVTDFTITIAANATSGTGTFTLTPTQDTEVEYNETIGVDGSSPNTTMTNATITLTDDDKDAVTLSLNRPTLSESASATSVTVTAAAATAISAARTVTVSVGGSGTATSGTDYTAVSDFTITIAANATSGTGTFTLTPTNDTSNEGDETIGVAGTNSLSTVTGTTLTLIDDDQPIITLSSTVGYVYEHAVNVDIDVTVTRPSNSTASAVEVTVKVGGSGGSQDSATKGVDYKEVPDFTITIPAGQTSASGSFAFTAIRDGIEDNDERVTIWGVATGYKISGTGAHNAGNGHFFVLSEWYTDMRLTADVSSVSESDGATTVTVTLHSTRYLYSSTYVDVSIGGGTATSGTDYAAVSNFRLSYPSYPTQTKTVTGTFTLTPTQDALLEGDETININGNGSYWNSYSGVGTSITLTDNQTISLSANPSSISEGASATQVAVSATATGTASTPRTVTVVVGGTGTATSGTDYAAVSNFDITIPANKTGATNTFTLRPTKDSSSEGDETIGVSGSNSTAYVYPTTLTLTDTNPAVTLSAAPSSISEGASATSVTVTATAAAALASARTVTVAVGGSGTATSGTDYAAVSDFTITIAANKTSGTGTFTLTPTDDTALEGDETIGLAGTSAEAATISGTTLTLTDDDLPTITLTTVPADIKVAEGAGRSSVTVRATAAAAMKDTTTVTLTVGASGDGATKTTDYTTSNVRTITIPKGQARGEASFELAPVQDALVEGDETVSVSGSSSGGHKVTGTSLTLTDDDKYDITLSASPSSVGEGASATTVTVTATAKSAASSARTVTVKVGGSGTATSGTDYAAVSDFTITIAANAKSGTGTFTLTPTQDTSVEGSETIGVAGTGALSTVTGTSVTLTDDDSYPAITLSANPSSVSEGASGTTVTVTATAASAISSARTVTVSVGGSGTASAGVDYATVADFTVTIAASATSGTGTFTLTPTQDTDVEGSETIGVAGTSPSSTVTPTTVTLTDDDTHSIDLSVSPTTVAENKASEQITVTATINAARTSATAVTVSVGDATDQATSGTDYKAVSDFTVTIAANATSGTGTFTFEPVTDNAYEGFEGITISGTTSSGGGANAQNASVNIPVTGTTLTLRDASNYPALTLSVSPSSVSEGASGTTVTVTATAASSIASSREVTVSVGGSGTATSGTDYAAVSDFKFRIKPDSTSGSGTFTLTPTQDAAFEGDETIGVSGTSLSTTVTGTTLTLTDDDNASVTVNDASASEGSDITFTVTLDNAVQGGLTVTPDFTDVTAVEGTDYDENTSAISFTGTANETKTFTVSTTQDAVVETNETFTVGLTVSKAPSGVTATDIGTGTINDDVLGNTDAATLTIADASASEGDDITFTVTLDKAVQGGLTVTPSYTNGTAASGDYTANTTGISFTGTANEQHTFTVSTTEDAVLEGNETFTIGLTVTGTTLTDRITSTDTGTGTINNDDDATVTVNDASADEGDDFTFTVTLDKAVQGGLTVTPGFTDGTAVEGTDYDENTTALSFTGTANETKTFTVSTTEDAILEGNETFTVNLAVSDAPSGVTSTDTGTGTINNDDGATVTVNNASADEGGDITFTVTLGAAVQGGLTVTPDFTDATAVEGTDYDENTTAISFTGTANETQTFKVSTTEDAVVEADETFTVGLSVSNAPSGVTATDTGTGTINNDDDSEVTIADASADEGDRMTLTVTLSEAVQGGLKVTPDFTDGTAVEGTDYDENTAALSFTGTKGETRTFTVQTTEDEVLEANETFSVGLTVSGTTLGSDITATDTGTGTIKNDDGAIVTVNDASVTEGGSMTFTVSLGSAVQGGLTVTPDFTDGTATEGTDYDENTTALSFTGTKGEKKAFTVATTQDKVVEGDETFTVGLTVSGTTLDIDDADTGTGTIDNDDATPSVALTVAPAAVSESASATTVTVTAQFSNDNTFPNDRTVTVSVEDATAEAGKDYTAVTDFDITIKTGTGTATGTFTLTPIQDNLVEGNETMTVSGSSTGLTVKGHPLTLNDDDEAVGVSLGVSVPGLRVGEGAAPRTVTVTATFSNGIAFPRDTTAMVSLGSTMAASGDPQPGEAVAGVDYVAVDPFNVTILAGKTSGTATFTLTPHQDRVVEGDETIPVHGVVGDLEQGLATITIGDDDATPEVDLAVDPAQVGEGYETTVTVTATFSNGNTLPQDRLVTVGLGGGASTATAGTDYAAVSDLNIVIPEGATSATETFKLTTVEDDVVEGGETVVVSGAAGGLTVNGTSVLVLDGDFHGMVLSAAPAEVGEDASATEVTVTATAGTAVAQPRDVTVTVGHDGDTATEGTDYAAVADFKLTIPANRTTGTATFTLAPTDDDAVEGDETISVTGESWRTVVTATRVTIVEDDRLDIVLSATPARVREDASETMVRVTATSTSTSASARTLTVTIGRPDDDATEGTDYAAVADFEVTIAANETTGSRVFRLTPIDDDAVEGDEAISVTGAGPLVTVAGTAITLVDDDSDPVTLSAEPARVDEDASPTTVTVTATATTAVSHPRTVTVSVGAEGDGATIGVDYAPVADFAVTIPAEATSGAATFTLTPIDDDVHEGDETISVTGAGARMTVTGTAVTLADDDPAATVNLSADPARVDEGAAPTPVTVTATLSSGETFAEDRTVTVGLAPGTATPEADHAAVDEFYLTIPAGESSGSATFTLTPIDDSLVEGDETIGVSGTADGLDVNGTELTLIDDDAVPDVDLAVDPAILAEDAAATTVTVSAMFTNGSTFADARTLTVSVGGGTATPETDHAVIDDFDVTIAAGESGGTATFTLAPTDDGIVEGDETIEVSGVSAGLTVNGTAMTLADDDEAVVDLGADPARISEGAGPTTVTVTAALSNGMFSEDRTIAVSVGGDGTASDGAGTASDADYQAPATLEVTIPAGQESGTATFTLAPNDDSMVEGDETIGLSGGGKGLKVNGTSITVADDDAIPDVNLGVDPERVDEGAAATTVTVTAEFSNGSTFPDERTVTVSVGGGTADPGADYDATPDFDVTIPAGQGSGTATFTLTPTDDGDIEGDETIEVTGVSDGLTVHQTELTLDDDDTHRQRERALKFSLAGIGRTIATQAVDAIGARFDAASRVSRPADDGRLDLDPFALAGILDAGGIRAGALHADSAFNGLAGGRMSHPTAAGLVSFALDDGGRTGTGGWTLWASGARTDFSGRPGGFSVDGSMGAAFLGVDRSLGSSGVLGVALSRNLGGVDLAGEGHWAGRVDARMTTVYPYAHWSPTPKLDLWGILGMGRGDIDLDDEVGDLRTDGRLRMAATGLRGDLARVGAVDLAVRADAFTVGMEADEVSGSVEATDGRAQRARLMLDASTDWALSSSSRFTPSFEVGARVDGGDVETGPGMEVGGGLAFVNARLGLDIAARGRWLAVHRDEHFGEWGGNLSIRRVPSDPDRGLSFSMQPAWGEDASGITALWEGRNLRRGDFGFGLDPEAATEAWRPDRLDMEVSYGAEVFDGRGALKPFGQLRMMGAGSRHLRVGTDLELVGADDDGTARLRLKLAGEQRAQAGGAPGYGAILGLGGPGLRAGGGVLAPFGEFSYEGASSRRLRFGTSLRPAAGDLLPGLFRLELLGEAHQRAAEGTKYGLVLRGGRAIGFE